MDAIQYETLSQPFRKHTKLLLLTNKVLTALGYITYPLLLVYSFLYEKNRYISFILIPATGFILLTFVRKKIKDI